MSGPEMVYGRKTYNTRLKEAGLEMGTEDFQNVVVEVWQCLFPDFTDEEILRRPIQCASSLVKEVRRRVKKADLDEDLITGHLLKPRKQPRD